MGRECPCSGPGVVAERHPLSQSLVVKMRAFRHQAESGGNRFSNFTLVRGSAIIGATASRQVW